MKRKAVVILSGGQDSSACAALEHLDHKEFELKAVTFDYGQRHRIEIESAIAVANYLEIEHEIITLPFGILASASPLISDDLPQTYQEIESIPDGIASTFIPMRNTLFITLAANRAIAMGANTVITGVSQTDYSGYPDCREAFIESMEASISLANWGIEGNFFILTPLMYLSKAETVELMQQCLGDQRSQVLWGLTHTCYNGVRSGCGRCAACLLRDKGFREAGIDDPLWRKRECLSI